MMTVMKCEPASPLPLCNHTYVHNTLRAASASYPFCENEKGDIFFFCRPYKVLSYDDDNSTPSTRNEIFSKWQTVLTLGSWLLSAFCLSLSGPALLRIDINELLKLQRSSRLDKHTGQIIYQL